MQSARDDLKITMDMLPPGHKDKVALTEEMRQVRPREMEYGKIAVIGLGTVRTVGRHKGMLQAWCAPPMHPVQAMCMHGPSDRDDAAGEA